MKTKKIDKKISKVMKEEYDAKGKDINTTLKILNKYLKEFLMKTAKEDHFRDRHLHCLRVCNYAEDIAKREGGDLEVLLPSALLHDIAKNIDDKSHGPLGSYIVKYILDSINFNKEKSDIISKIIKIHSNKKTDKEKLSLEEKILMDADLLDEVGLLTVINETVKIDAADSKAYKKIIEQVKSKYELLKKDLKLLKTEYGYSCYLSKLEMVGILINMLEEELRVKEFLD